ncbi:hypothetical protein [Mycobacterium marinum]|uniref:hypothetical protein n=1 Tax=Mycobacterium marinum TaxID=1781 RepID=UPI003565301D
MSKSEKRRATDLVCVLYAPGHPHTDPKGGRTECNTCGKWVFECAHSCKGVPVTDSAWERWRQRHQGGAS